MSTRVIETDCRSDEGVTVGLIDSLISICRVLNTRDLDYVSVHEALQDLRTDADVLEIMGMLVPDETVQAKG